MGSGVLTQALFLISAPPVPLHILCFLFLSFPFFMLKWDSCVELPQGVAWYGVMCYSYQLQDGFLGGLPYFHDFIITVFKGYRKRTKVRILLLLSSASGSLFSFVFNNRSDSSFLPSRSPTFWEHHLFPKYHFFLPTQQRVFIFTFNLPLLFRTVCVLGGVGGFQVTSMSGLFLPGLQNRSLPHLPISSLFFVVVTSMPTHSTCVLTLYMAHFLSHDRIYTFDGYI